MISAFRGAPGYWKGVRGYFQAHAGPRARPPPGLPPGPGLPTHPRGPGRAGPARRDDRPGDVRVRPGRLARLRRAGSVEGPAREARTGWLPRGPAEGQGLDRPVPLARGSRARRAA